MNALDHYNFITNTDRKSLCTQIQNLVSKATEVAKDEFQQRRHSLQQLLEYERKFYEKEFTKKVKLRIDDNIIERKNALVKIKEKNEHSALAFLEKKRLQQQMENCYEVRKALRQKARQNMRECLLEQMLEKERNLAREIHIDQQWEEMQRKDRQRIDEQQQKEECLKHILQQSTNFGLEVQLREKFERSQQQSALKQKELESLAGNMEILRLEKLNKLRKGPPKKAVALRQEMHTEVEMKNAKRLAENSKRIELEKKVIAELCQVVEEEKVALHSRKLDMHQSMLEFIAYSNRMRGLEQDLERYKNERIDDLLRVDICTKRNIKLEKKRRAEKAAKCFAELRQQMCEMVERRMRDEVKADNFGENVFARQEISREGLLEQRRRNRSDLDKQIQELDRIRAAEVMEMRNGLNRAIDDPNYFARLAEEYVRDGIDYLEPHPNWRILACSSK